jgi:DNA-binding NtrC family response regulator
MAETVLLADDDDVYRIPVITLLQRGNFLVLPCCNGEEALEISRRTVAIDGLVTDVQMGSGMNGFDLAERLLNERPGIAVLLMSGYSSAEALAAKKRLPFLAKPFRPAVLIARLREVLASKVPAESERQTKSNTLRTQMSPQPSARSRKEIEEIWCTRLKDADAAYGLAIKRFTSTPQEYNSLTRPDGSLAVRKVRQQESAARDEYMRILRIFTDLTVHGKIPEEH